MAKKSLKIVDKSHTKHRDGTVFQIKITLSDAPVPIWRRLLLSADMPLSIAHEVFQISMGWWDYHFYHFESKGRHFGCIDAPTDDKTLEDDLNFTLNELVSVPEDNFVYMYDFGDKWMHKIVLEEVLYPPGKRKLIAHCVTGRRACPPEDVGGVIGYAEFLNIVEDPHHKKRQEKLEWVGGDFEPNSFDIRGVNNRLELLTQPITEFEFGK